MHPPLLACTPHPDPPSAPDPQKLVVPLRPCIVPRPGPSSAPLFKRIYTPAHLHLSLRVAGNLHYREDNYTSQNQGPACNEGRNPLGCSSSNTFCICRRPKPPPPALIGGCEVDGPHPLKYLRGYCEIRISETTLEAAVKKVSEQEGCDGVTQEADGRFTGRTTSVLRDSTHETSWIVRVDGIARCSRPPSPPAPPAFPVGPPPACACGVDGIYAVDGPTSTCKATGDPHYLNFASQKFDFFARGLYEHARFVITPCGCEVTIHVFLVKLIAGKHRANSAIAATAIRVGDLLITITKGGVVTVDGPGVSDVKQPESQLSNQAYGRVALQREKAGRSYAWRVVFPASAPPRPLYPLPSPLPQPQPPPLSSSQPVRHRSGPRM